jgi:outer membrane autotransporter protein
MCQGSNTQDWNLSREGIQVGSDLFRTRSMQLSMLFGTTSGRAHNKNDSIENDDIYLGIYGAKIFRNGIDIRRTFAYGWQDYDMSRVFENDAYLSSFKGKTTESNLELGKSVAFDRWTLRPVFAVEVFTNNVNGASEKDGFTYDENNLTQVFLRTGADLSYRGKRFNIHSGMYYSYDVHGEDLRTGVRIQNYRDTLSGGKLG